MTRPAPTPSSTERLAGIEWMRGVAAFAVICIHAGIAVHNRTTPSTEVLRDGFGFAVPFFLMTSFFFAVRAEKIRPPAWGEWIKRRAGRLLVPFVFWSMIYFALHLVKLVVHHHAYQIKELISDPAALVLSGGTSVALYFLPLLFTGLLLIRLLSSVFQRFPSWTLVIGLLLALVLRGFNPGETFNMNGTGISEAPVLLIIGLLKDGIRCSPLVFAAGLLVRWLPLPGVKNAYPMLFTGLLLLVILPIENLPSFSADLVSGLGAFLLGWGLSGLLVTGKWATIVGLFSFGVYLVHQIFLELIQAVFPYTEPVGVIGILAITITVYIASMLTVGLANRSGNLAQRIFGLK